MSTLPSRQLCVVFILAVTILSFSAEAVVLDTSVRLPESDSFGTRTVLPRVNAEVTIPVYSGLYSSNLPVYSGNAAVPQYRQSANQITIPKVTGEITIPGFQGNTTETGLQKLFTYTRPDIGILTVRTIPDGARIFLDGSYSGISPLSLSKVYAGVHALSVMCPGYLTYTKVVRIESGKETIVEAVLSPLESETPAATPVPSPMGLTAVDQAIVKYTNLERTSRGLPALAWDGSLAAIAYNGSMDMKSRNFFSHINPDGHDPFWRLASAGYGFAWAGENIAASSRISEGTDPDEVGRYFVQDLWMTSPGHKANILNTHFTLIGVGTVYENDMTLFPNGFISTQLFASRE